MEAIFEALLQILVEFIFEAVSEVVSAVAEVVIENIVSFDFPGFFNRQMPAAAASPDEIITLNINNQNKEIFNK